jgi:hypothetical protein
VAFWPGLHWPTDYWPVNYWPEAGGSTIIVRRDVALDVSSDSDVALDVVTTVTEVALIVKTSRATILIVDVT